MSEIPAPEPAAPPPPFTGNDDPVIITAKSSLLTALQTNNAEFRNILSMTPPEVSRLCNATLDFFECYFGFYSVFSSSDFTTPAGFSAKAFPETHPLYKKFTSAKFDGPADQSRKAPDNVIYQTLRFYSSIVAVDKAARIPLVTQTALDDLAKNLVDMYTTKKGSADMFDVIAVRALENLFWTCYPKYLLFKGNSAPMLKINGYALDWEKSVLPADAMESIMATGSLQERLALMQKMDEEMEGVDEAPIWDANRSLPSYAKMSFFGSKNFAFVPTKVCLVATLKTPAMCKKFQKYCKENNFERGLICYESFSQLEAKSKRRADLRKYCLERFLDGKPADTSEGTRMVSPGLIPLYLHFYGMFVLPGSKFEVVAPDAVKKEIAAKIANVGKDGIKTNLFDGVIDNVFENLFQNIFTPFTKA